MEEAKSHSEDHIDDMAEGSGESHWWIHSPEGWWSLQHSL